MKGFWKTTILVCLIYLAGAMVLAPVDCVRAARAAVELCLEVVIPSLFPFFVCSNLFVSLGAASVLSKALSRLMRPLFGVPGSGALAAVMGTVSGYPVGASCAVRLYEEGSCTKEEAERLLTFCSNSGPMFVLGAVGVGMLGNRDAGVLLYAAHVLAALMTGILFRRFGEEGTVSECRMLPPAAGQGMKNPAAAVGTAVAAGVDTLLKVCGFVIVFAVFAAALPDYPGSRILHALLEITGGIRALAEEGVGGGMTLPLISLFLGLSGLSVLMQTAAVVLPSGLSLRPYILGKLTQGVFAMGLTALFLRLLPGVQKTFAAGCDAFFLPSPEGLLACAGMSVFWSFLALGIMAAAAWGLEKFSCGKGGRRRKRKTPSVQRRKG